MIIFGIETLIFSFISKANPREAFNFWLQAWLKWENEQRERQLVLIGSDIGKGIVPMEKDTRNWRDLVGWCFQDVTRHASRVDVIWYGLNQQLK